MMQDRPGADLRSSWEGHVAVIFSHSDGPVWWCACPQSLVNTALLSDQELVDFHKMNPDHGGHVVCASWLCLGGLFDQLSDN